MKDQGCYVRNPSVVVISMGDELLFALPPPARRLVSVSTREAGGLRTLIDELVAPLSQGKVATQVPARTLELLVSERILLTVAEPAARSTPDRPRSPSCRRLVVGVSGAAYAAFIAPVVTILQHTFAEQVDLVFTRAAATFVNPSAFSAFGFSVWTDMFERRPGAGVPHMTLATQADLVLVMPASAHCLSRLASGACSDLLSLVVAATRAPVVVAPAMNAAMWANPAIRRNVARLREDGRYVIEPRAGAAIAAGTAGQPEIGAAGADPHALPPALAAIIEHHQARAAV